MKTVYWSYVDGFVLSNLAAYSSGTGTLIGITSAEATVTAVGLSSSKTIVRSSGVLMPGMSLILPGVSGAPLMSAKYEVA